MRGLGLFLVVLGVLSAAFVLFKLPLAFIVLLWIDTWGATIGWIIRGVLIVAGLGLIYAGGRKK